jgi:hypothetical protein
MIQPTKVWKSGVVVWQEAPEDSVPELPVLVHIDSGGIIVLDQEDRSIVLQPGTVKQLCEVLKSMAKGTR